MQGTDKRLAQEVASKVLQDDFDGNQVQMGRAFGVSQPTVSDWVNGRSSPSLSNLRKLADLSGNNGLRRLTSGLGDDTLGVAIQYGQPGTGTKWPSHVVVEAIRISSDNVQRSAVQWTAVLADLLAGKR